MFRNKARKSLGQHFLKSKKIAEKIITSLDIKAGDEVVEIGPGRGALTEVLLIAGCRITAIEIDPGLCRELTERFSRTDRLRIICADFLEIETNILPNKFKLVGNIPYNRTAAILARIIEMADLIEIAVITLQAEVASKLIARPKTQSFGLLTLLVATAYKTEKLFTIPAFAFAPAPMVKSAVVRLTPHGNQYCDRAAFVSFLKSCFVSKKKFLANSMRLGLNLNPKKAESIVSECCGTTKVRVTDLGLSDFYKLFLCWRSRCAN